MSITFPLTQCTIHEYKTSNDVSEFTHSNCITLSYYSSPNTRVLDSRNFVLAAAAVVVLVVKTRQHSSRMRTDRRSGSHFLLSIPPDTLPFRYTLPLRYTLPPDTLSPRYTLPTDTLPPIYPPSQGTKGEGTRDTLALGRNLGLEIPYPPQKKYMGAVTWK